MLPPYTSEEVAEAVFDRLEELGAHALAVTATADTTKRSWRLGARMQDGRELSGRYPFADRDGIHTPAELADWFARAVAGST